MKIERTRQRGRSANNDEEAIFFFASLYHCRTDFILSLQACGLQRGCHVVKITAEPETRGSRRRMLVRGANVRVRFRWVHERRRTQSYARTSVRSVGVHRYGGKLARARLRMGDASLLCDNVGVAVNLPYS